MTFVQSLFSKKVQKSLAKERPIGLIIHLTDTYSINESRIGKKNRFARVFKSI